MSEEHLVDIMFPNHTKSFFNQFMKERFPNEGSRSYISEWYGRFITMPNYNINPEEDKEGNYVEPLMSNFYFIHDSDGEESFYPYAKCDYESTDIWFKIMRERLDKLEEAHNESKAEYNKRKTE
tara:strand:+ start:400 stop:771 length:372 start_codon:yes stop_codon:yes gene_type:complete